MSSQHGELRLTSGWDRFDCLGHSSKFQRVLRLGLVTAATSLNGSQPNFARCLAVSWAGTLYIHFRGLLLHNGILSGTKFTFRPSLALSYIGSVTAPHSSSGRQTKIAELSRGRHLYSAGRPSRWALAHILVINYYQWCSLAGALSSKVQSAEARGPNGRQQGSVFGEVAAIPLPTS